MVNRLEIDVFFFSQLQTSIYRGISQTSPTSDHFPIVLSWINQHHDTGIKRSTITNQKIRMTHV